MFKKSFACVLAAAALMAGSAMTVCADGDTLNVQFVPTNNDGSMEAKTGPFADYLSEKLGMDVEVTLATDYSTIVEAMASGKVDLGIMPPAAYESRQRYEKPGRSEGQENRNLKPQLCKRIYLSGGRNERPWNRSADRLHPYHRQ